MYCDQCGAENRDIAKYCVKCGARLLGSEQKQNSTTNSYRNDTATKYEIRDLSKLSEQAQKSDDIALKSVEQSKEISNIARIEKLTLWEVVKSLNTFDGRITRATAWKVIGLYILFVAGCLAFAMVFHFLGMNESTIEICGLIVLIPHLYLSLTINTSLFVQRLHDLGLSGFLWWFTMLPFLYLCNALRKSYNTVNAYYGVQQEPSEVHLICVFILAFIILSIYLSHGEDRPNDYGSTRK